MKFKPFEFTVRTKGNMVREPYRTLCLSDMREARFVEVAVAIIFDPIDEKGTLLFLNIFQSRPCNTLPTGSHEPEI